MNQRANGVAAAMLVLSAAAPAQQIVGIGIHPNQNAPVEARALPLGVSIRTDFQWRWIEHTFPGALDFGNYTKYEAQVTSDVQKGAKPIITLCCAPSFYDGGDLPKSPAAIQEFARYAEFVVHHFKDRVTLFEVWNEWNLNTGSKLVPKVFGDAGDYVNLLKAASSAIKSANPNAVVVAGAVGGTDARWIEKFIKAGGMAYADAFSVHPYVHRHVKNHPDSREHAWLGNAAVAERSTSAVPGTPEEAIAWLDELHTRLTEAAGKPVPIYVTEFGWPTSSSEFGVSEQMAATYLQRFVLLARTRPWIAGMWWYDLVDDGADGSDDNNRFGLLRQNGDPKPAYNAVIQLEEVIAPDAELRQSSGPDGQITVSGTVRSGRFSASWLPTDNVPNTSPASGAASGTGVVSVTVGK